MNLKIALSGIAFVLAALVLAHALRTPGNSEGRPTATVSPDEAGSSGRDDFDAVFNEERLEALQQPGEKREVVAVEPGPLPPEEQAVRQVRRPLPGGFEPGPKPASVAGSETPQYRKAGAGSAMPEDGPGARPAADPVDGPAAGPGEWTSLDSSTGPGEGDMDIQSLGPGANEYDARTIDELGIYPGPGPGEGPQEPPGRGPGADDPRTPLPTIPDRPD